jgi:DNA-binding LacI/PurR family transcriptional regulator
LVLLFWRELPIVDSMKVNSSGSQLAGRKRKGKSPLYRAVIKALQQQLNDGELSAGVKVPALHELARRFNVSVNTIRNAIRVLEEEGRLYHVPGVGSFVHPSRPDRLATGVTVALATIDIGGAFEMGIAQAVEQACQQRGWALQIYDAQGDAQLESRNLLRLTEAPTRGAIIVPISNTVNLETLVRLKLAGVPIVLVDRGVPGLNLDLVESDHEKGAFLATQYLLQHGHRHVLMVTESPSVTSVAQRIDGFDRALLDHGLERRRGSTVFISPEASVRGLKERRRYLGAFEAVLPVLQTVERPVAIFAHNDYSAWGVFEACRELRLRVPEDVSIICFDDTDITRAMSPRITTIAQRPWDIGRTALELLERRLQPEHAGAERQHVLIDVDLIERESVSTISPP